MNRRRTVVLIAMVVLFGSCTDDGGIDFEWVFDAFIVRDITPSDLASLGLRIVRTLCVGMHPLHGDHRLAHLGSSRLWNTRRHFPFAERDATLDTLNPWPHPFP